MSITHTFVSGIADGADATLVRPVNWNAVHTLSTGEVIPIKVRKTADETVNNSNVQQNDDHLFFAVAANEVWKIFMYLIMSAANATPNFRFCFTVPAGGGLQSNRVGDIGVLTGATAVLTSVDNVTDTYAYVLPIGTRVALMWIMYTGGANAGTVQFQWAQSIAHASDTKLLTNSYLIAHKLA